MDIQKFGYTKMKARNDCDKKFIQITKNKQIIGNQGLYFVSFILSQKGFNTTITARNAKGADIIIYNENCDNIKTIQVKSTTKRLAVNVGQFADEKQVPHLICDYWIFVDLEYEIPRCYVFTRDEAQNLVVKNYKAAKDGKFNWWLQPKAIYSDEFLDKWEKINV